MSEDMRGLVERALDRATAQALKTWTVAGAIKAQSELCTTLRLPIFAPSNGVCFACYRQIYEAPDGVDGTGFVTGCPWCHRSYCE